MHSFPGLHEVADHAGPRRLALALLVLFAAIFAACNLAPRSLWVDGLKAVAEAAMVGALADWFAVAALFRRIPLPLVGRHTDIVARNKDRIGGNLALFVRDRFLDAPSLVAMIRRHDPADMLAQWLTAPANAGLLGRQVSRLALMALDTVEDEKIQAFLAQAARALLGRLDLSRSMASALAALTHQGRHQELLDALLERLGGMVRTEEARAFVADTLVQWIRREHPLKQKVLPTDWLSGKGAAAITHAVDTLLKAVADDPRHELREALDGALARLAERLQNDPDWARRGEARSCAPGCRTTRRWAATCATCGPACAVRCARTWPARIRSSRAAWPRWASGWACRSRATRRCACA